MGRKAYLLIVCLVFLFVLSCSKGNLRKSEKSKDLPSISEGVEDVSEIDVPVDDLTSDLKPTKTWAVWVRGLAVDSFAGLGFLQQLESMNIHPSKVAGTGMGCWIAMSWALRNRGNYAEWQSMKFDSWKGFETSFIGGLGAGGRKQKFINYINELKSSQKQSLYEIPLDCPLYEKKNRSLNLARDLNLEGRLYKQFDLPLLELGSFKEDESYQSGSKVRSHGEDLLESLSEDLRGEKDATSWLILETSANHRYWGSAKEVVRGVTRTGVRWLRLPIASDLNISAQQLKDFRLRRKWVLEGRRDAKSFLHSEEIKEFLGL